MLQKTDAPLIEDGPGETLKQLIVRMQTPSEPRQGSVPTTAIPGSPPMGDGGPGATNKYLIALMQTPAENRQVVTSRPSAPAPSPAAMAPLPPPAVPPLPPEGERFFAKKAYRIGPEDVVRVSVWDNPELTTDVTVKPDGNISLPLMKDIHAANLTPMELSDVVTKNLREYIYDPRVSVIVTQTNSSKVYLVGNVNKPGSYPLRQDMTVLQALALAGGFTTFASPRDMKVIRDAGTRQETRKINYYKMIESVEQSDYMLKPGDTIVIP
jgi:polysaccharide export outer membrane protein